MLKAGTFLRISKVADRSTPDETTLALNYTVEGELLKDLEIGSPLSLLRTSRNGIPVLGFFQTSLIESMTLDASGLCTIDTQNSTYVVSVLKEEAMNA